MIDTGVRDALSRHVRVISWLRWLFFVCLFFSFFIIFSVSRITTFFKAIRDMLFQCSVQRLFPVDEHIVLLEENTARNPEFDYDRFEFPNAKQTSF